MKRNSYWITIITILLASVVLPFQSVSAFYQTGSPDFELRFRAKFDTGGSLEIRFSETMMHWYEIVVNTREVTFKEYFGHGMASSTIDERDYGQAHLNLIAGQWYEIEVERKAESVSLSIDGSSVKTIQMGFELVDVGVQAHAGNVEIADQQRTDIDLSARYTQILEESPALAQSWIAFTKDRKQLWLIRPDGSEFTAVDVGTVDYINPIEFSQDGAYFTFATNQGLHLLALADRSTRLIWHDSTSESAVCWTSDDHVLVLENENQSITLHEIDPANGKEKTRYIIPAVVDQGQFQASGSYEMDCSPSTRQLIANLNGSIDGQFANRYVLFDLDTQQTTVLPGNQRSIWSADGKRLYTVGGFISLPELRLEESPRRYDIPLRVSPNGQFVAIPQEGPTNVAFYQEGDEMFRRTTAGLGGWSPDSRYIVFDQGGRVFVADLISEREVQIAVGSVPRWQPLPELAQSMVEIQPTALPVFTIEPAPAVAAAKTPYTPTEQAQASTENTPANAEETAYLPEKSPAGLAVPFIVLGSGSMVIGGIFIYKRRKMPTWTIATPIFLGAALITIGLVLLTSRPTTEATQAAVPATHASAIPASPIVQPADPTQPAEPSSADGSFICQGVDLTSADLVKVYGAVKAAQLALTADPGWMTRLTELPQQTMEAEIIKHMIAECNFERLSFSPDGSKILLENLFHYEPSLTENVRNVIYSADGQPLWVSTIAPARSVWSPDGQKLALLTNSAWQIVDANSGAELANIPHSTRMEGWCFTDDALDTIAWFQDGQRLARKIYNAVQIIDASTGEVLSEIPTDETAMGTMNPEGRATTCGYSLLWSASGERFATIGSFPTYLNGNPSDSYHTLKIWNTVSGSLEAEYKIEDGFNAQLMTWSPDEKYILYYADTALLLVDIASGNYEILAIPEVGVSAGDTWSPDKQKLIVSGYQSSYLYDMATHSATAITHPDGFRLNAVTWFPQGQRFLFKQADQGWGYWIYSVDSGSWTELDQAGLR